MDTASEDIVWWPYYIVDKNSGRPHFSISDRVAVAFISILSLISCFVDIATSEENLCCCRRAISFICCCRCPISEHIDSLRQLLLYFFQMANLLLLLAAMVENSMLVELYVWYVLAFVLMGLGVSLAQFLIRVKQQGVMWAVVGALPEVAFLFVLFWCLPLVNKYGKDLKGV